MADLRLAAVQPAGLDMASRGIARDGRRQQPQRRRPRRPASHLRLIAMLAPGHEPDACEIEFETDTLGRLIAVNVREVATGAVLASVDPTVLAIPESDADGGREARGLLLERRA